MPFSFNDYLGRNQTNVPNPVPSSHTSTPEGNVSQSTEDDNTPSGALHNILRKTDFWFNYAASELEKRARILATEQAQAGLPRQDVAITEEYEPEGHLRGAAMEIFHNWKDRVSRKIHDSIQESIENSEFRLISLRRAIDAAEVGSAEVIAKEAELNSLLAQNTGSQSDLAYGTLLSRKFAYVIVLLLIPVDWIANIPIFRELLPQDPGSLQAWQKLTARYENSGYWGGFQRMFAHITFNPEVTIFALGVVLFLLFFGHVCGVSARKIIAFNIEDEPHIGARLNSHKRQSRAPMTAATLAVVFLLGFLFISRETLPGVTEKRELAARKVVAAAQQKLTEDINKQDINALSKDRDELAQAQDDLESRNQTNDYASSISTMNFPMFFLNIALIIAAGCASYLSDETKFTTTKVDDTRIAHIRQEIAVLRSKTLTNLQTVRDAEASLKAENLRARYLAKAQPLQDWEAKASRLQGVIPLFRLENARIRGIDIRNIKAFEEERRLDINAPELNIQPDLEHLTRIEATALSIITAFDLRKTHLS